ncbi:hypothetical protein [Georgenia ruanii]|uniref:hypothetical protein n=1 Tax=Georgenia ruanii TaxID=348442 RepID=UPI00126463E6|nr:hypothetical protein [Georgenia ruanii]
MSNRFTRVWPGRFDPAGETSNLPPKLELAAVDAPRTEPAAARRSRSAALATGNKPAPQKVEPNRLKFGTVGLNISRSRHRLECIRLKMTP